MDTTGKDYIDAKLSAATIQMIGDIKAANAIADGRFAVIEARIDARIASIESKMDAHIVAIDSKMSANNASMDAKMNANNASIEAKMDANFARFEAALHKSMADSVKWVAGTVIAFGVIGVSQMTFFLNNVTPKATPPAPAPIIFYAQPAPLPLASPAIVPQQPIQQK